MKILFIADVVGWAFDRCCMNLVRELNSAGHTADMAYQYFVPPIDHDFVFVSWWGFLPQITPSKKTRVICKLADEVTWTRLSSFKEVQNKVDLFLGTSKKIVAMARERGLKCELLPDSVDVNEFYYSPTQIKNSITVAWLGNPKACEWAGVKDGKNIELMTLCRNKVRQINGKPVIWRVESGISANSMTHFYDGVDVIASFSKTEGTCLPVLEGLAKGKLVLSTESGIAPEIKSAGLKQFADCSSFIKSLTDLTSGDINEATRQNRISAGARNAGECAKILCDILEQPFEQKHIHIFTGEYETHRGGVGTSTRQLSKALKNYSFTVYEQRQSLQSYYIGRTDLKRPLTERQVVENINKEDTAIFEYTYFEQLAKKLDCRKVLRLHGLRGAFDIPHLPKNEQRGALWCATSQNEIAKSVNEIWALNKEQAAHASELFKKPVQFLANGLEVVGDRKGVLFLGECLVWIKGFDTLLTAAQELRTIPFTVMGRAETDLINQMKNAGINHIPYTDDRDAIKLQLLKHRLLAVPSRHEGQPYVVLEAMRCFTPVLCANWEGVESLNLHPLSVCKDRNLFAQMIKTLYHHPDIDDVAIWNMKSYLDNFTLKVQTAKLRESL